MPIPQITLGPLSNEQTEAAIGLLARAYVANPLHLAAFGPARLDANEAFFRIGLEVLKGRKVAATDGSRMLGVAHWVRSPACQVKGSEKLRMMPRMARRLGLRPTLRVVSWVSTWSRHDPAEPHWHLGPIGVEPNAQGRGIGGMLMEQYCEELDRDAAVGYLETDHASNVDFYSRFGFVTTATASVLGVENWFMRRARRGGG